MEEGGGACIPAWALTKHDREGTEPWWKKWKRTDKTKRNKSENALHLRDVLVAI